MRVAAVLALVAAFLVAPPACDAQQLLAPQTLAARPPIFARSADGKVTSVVLSPDTATVEVGDSALLTAIVKNQFGSSVKQAVVWTVRDTAMVKLANIADRSVSAIAKAKVGTTWVDGTVGSLTDSTRITVISTATLTSVVIAPTQWSLASADTKQFTATARWSDGTTRAVSPTWAATGGTITQAGLYTAGATGGSFAVTASSAGKTTSAAITITAALPAATITAVVVTPATASMNVNGFQQFTASATWTDGNSHPFTPAWTATGGTVTSAGFYTAGAMTGTYNVIASASGKADTAVVTLALPVGAALLRDDAFASLTGWQTELCCSYSATIVSGSVDGSTMLRDEVRSTDPLVAGRTRAEILRPTLSNWPNAGVTCTTVPPCQNGPFAVGDTAWYGFWVYLPTSWVQDNAGATTQGESIQQIHDTPDPVNGVIDWNKGRAPILSFQFRGSNWLVVDESGGPYPATPVWREFDLGPATKGVWTAFVVHGVWRNDAQGRLEIWKNGVQLVNFTGPTTFQNVLPGFFKLGIHKWIWTTPGLAPRIAYYDQLRIAGPRGSYGAVAPR